MPRSAREWLLLLLVGVAHAAVIEVTAGGSYAEDPTYSWADANGVMIANMTADAAGNIIASSNISAADFQLRSDPKTTMTDLVQLVEQQQTIIAALQVSAGACAFVGARMTIASTTYTTFPQTGRAKITLDVTEFASSTVSTSNSRFQTSVPGYYSCIGNLWRNVAEGEYVDLLLKKSGVIDASTRKVRGKNYATDYGAFTINLQSLMYLTSTDYVELWGGGGATDGSVNNRQTHIDPGVLYLACHLVGT